MKLEVTNKEENTLLSRSEITGKLSYTGATPSTLDVKKALSKELKVGEDQIVVKHITTHFGSAGADISAYSYTSKDVIKDIESIHKKQVEKEQKAAEEAKKKAEEAKAAPAEEDKAEEKPAEAPAEEKKEDIPKEATEETKEEAKAEEAPKEEAKEAPAEEKKE